MMLSTLLQKRADIEFLGHGGCLLEALEDHVAMLLCDSTGLGSGQFGTHVQLNSLANILVATASSVGA